MKEILEQLEFEELPMLSGFCKEINKRGGNSIWRLSAIEEYTNFILQPLIKSMFVPVGEDGEVLTKPEDKSFYQRKDSTQSWGDYLSKEFHQAQERVLFEPEYGTCFQPLADGTIAQLKRPRIQMKGTIEQAINNRVKLKLK